jgi:hypothetical protein
MLVAIDEARQNDATGYVDDLVEVFCVRHFCGRPNASDFCIIGRNKAARMNRAASVNSDDKSIF